MLWYNQPGFGSAPAPKHSLSLFHLCSLFVSLSFSICFTHTNPANPNPALPSKAWHILRGKKKKTLQYPLDILLVPAAKLNRGGRGKGNSPVWHLLPFLLWLVHPCKISLKLKWAGDKNSTPFSDSCTQTHTPGGKEAHEKQEKLMIMRLFKSTLKEGRVHSKKVIN